jgi:hypothetical protein
MLDPEKAKIALAALAQSIDARMRKPCCICGSVESLTFRGEVHKVEGGVKAYAFWTCRKHPFPSGERLSHLESKNSGDIFVRFFEGNLDDHLSKLIAEVDWGNKIKF